MIKAYTFVLYSPESIVRHLGKALIFVKSVQQTACSSVKAINLFFCCLLLPLLRRKNHFKKKVWAQK